MKVSFALMVKNEEELLPQCLESIVKYADEIVIVDTGSTDRTVEIAKLYTEKIYFHEWENNFSKHRNQSIGYANGDWIFYIDADETFHLCTGTKWKDVKKLLSQQDESISAIQCILEDIKDGSTFMVCDAIRCFRSGHVRFENIVHNKPVIKNKTLINDLFYFKHFGYDLSKEKMDKKFVRSSTLLKKQIEQDPKNWQAHFYLAQQYGQHGHIDKMFEHANIYINNKDPNDSDFMHTIWFSLSRQFLDADEIDKAIKVSKTGLKYTKNNPDLYLSLAESYVQKQESAHAILYIHKYLHAATSLSHDRSGLKGTFLFTVKNELLLAQLARLLILYLYGFVATMKDLKRQAKYISKETMEEIKTNIKQSGIMGLLKEFTVLTPSQRKRMRHRLKGD